jgi:hypothetical protein
LLSGEKQIEMARKVKSRQSIMYYGTEYAENRRVSLRAGPLSAFFQNGDLCYIRYGGKEIIRRVYIAFRDKQWETLSNILRRTKIKRRENSFHAKYEARNISDDIDFVWTATFIGQADGTINLSFVGEARKDFYRNRIGFCLLHPQEYAGFPCRYQTADSPPDRVVSSHFPLWISPHQPFKNIRRFEYQIEKGIWIRLDFGGDVFEMEDQRNWTDSSYKTYSTPLHEPYPVFLSKGDSVKQEIELSIHQDSQRDTTTDTVGCFQAGCRDTPVVTIKDMPEGNLCTFGFAINDHLNKDLSESEKSLISRLSPAHLRVDVDLDRLDWGNTIERGNLFATELQVPLWLLLKSNNSFLRPDLCEFLAKFSAVEAVMVTKNEPPWTTSEGMAADFRLRCRTSGLQVRVGGGTDGWFVYLNRNRPDPDSLDFVFYAMSPQVHLSDNLAVMENTAAQEQTVRSAFKFFNNRPVVVGPVTLHKRFRPARRESNAGTNEVIAGLSGESRQRGLFAAVWTLLSMKYLSKGGAEAATYFEVEGESGLYKSVCAEPCGFQLYPVYQVFLELSDKQGWEVLEVISTHPDEINGFALRATDSCQSRETKIVYVANQTFDSKEVKFSSLAWSNCHLSLLSEHDWIKIVSDPDYRWSSVGSSMRKSNPVTLKLPPYSIARILVE